MKIVGSIYVLSRIGLIVVSVTPGIRQGCADLPVAGADTTSPLLDFSLGTRLMLDLEMLVAGLAVFGVSRDAGAKRIRPLSAFLTGVHALRRVHAEQSKGALVPA